MNITVSIALAVALAADAFAVSVCKGLAVGKVKIKHLLLCGVWFGAFQALMPFIGYLLGSAFSSYIEKFDHWVAFVLLLAIGANMIKEAFGEEEEANASFSFGTMLLMAIATSIDALAAGITLPTMGVNVALTIVLIGVITCALSAVGVKIGSIFGAKYRFAAELCGGILLILLSLKILLEHLEILAF